jgi:hypothetical protein
VGQLVPVGGAPGRRDEGVVAILVVAMTLLLFGLAAIVVDLGVARTLRSRASDSADAAALAGVPDLASCSRRSCNAARDRIKASATDNYDVTGAEWSGCAADPPRTGDFAQVDWRTRRSRTPCIQFGIRSGDSLPSLIFVAMPNRDSGSFFGGIFGYQGASVGGQAVAGVSTPTAPACALCVLDKMTGTGGAVTVTRGSVYLSRATATGNSSISGAAGVFARDDPCPAPVDPTCPPHYLPTLTVTGTATNDPFSPAESHPVPDIGGGSPDDVTCSSGTLEPGEYHDPVDITSDCALVPGRDYVFRDPVTIEKVLAAAVSSDPTRLYFLDDVTVAAGGSVALPNGVVVLADSADLTVRGGGNAALSAPATPADHAAIFAGGNNRVHLDGGTLNVTGDVYLRSGDLSVDAAPTGGGGATVTGLVVVDDVDSSGTVAVTPLSVPNVVQKGAPYSGLVR